MSYRTCIVLGETEQLFFFLVVVDIRLWVHEHILNLQARIMSSLCITNVSECTWHITGVKRMWKEGKKEGRAIISIIFRLYLGFYH